MKKRKDSFLGIHFDFHSRGDKPVAPELGYDVAAKMLDEVKPDYVQIDTKGHPGFSSYPTKVGNPAPVIIGNQVKMWRELTAERGITLYAHHSGLFDQYAAKLHPEWAIKNADGTVSSDYMSVFGDYDDKLLIPQLIELAVDMKFDGVWIDGECWAVHPDYSMMATTKWKQISDSEPPKPGEDSYSDYIDFIRKGFEDHVKHYTSEVKKIAPDFEITSNWIYSAYMPEHPNVKVDFLSGDYSPRNSVNSARINGRYIACHGIPWDLMAWGHDSDGTWTSNNRSTKEYVQYAQEAAYVISLGGGFQFYNIQYGEGGTIQEWAIPIWKKTADFVREREPFLKDSSLVHETAVFLPTEAHYAAAGNPFTQCSPSMASANGLIHISQDCGMSTEVIETYRLDRANEYKLIMLGRADVLSEKSLDLLNNYVKNGGSLVIASPETSGRFGFDIGDIRDELIYIEAEGALAPIYTRYAPIYSTEDEEVIGKIYFNNYMHGKSYPAAVSKKVGSGRITALAFDLGSAYPNNRTSCIRNFWKNMSFSLYSPLVMIGGSSYAEITLSEKHGRLLINLLNHAGEHAAPGARGYNEIPSIGPINITINTAPEPKSIFIEPGHIEWNGDNRHLTLERLDIHSIISVGF